MSRAILSLELRGGPLDGQTVAFEGRIPHMPLFNLPHDLIGVGPSGAIYRRLGAPDEDGVAEFSEWYGPTQGELEEMARLERSGEGL